MNIPMPNEVQPVSFLEYANQFADFGSRKQQQRLIDMKMQQMPQEQARRDRLADANIDSMETEGMADKHKLAIQISSGIYNAMQQSGLQENDPAFQQQLEQVSRPLRPILSKVFGVPDDPTKPTDWNGIKSLAMAGQQQDNGYHPPAMTDKGALMYSGGAWKPIEINGQVAMPAAQSPELQAAVTNAREGQKVQKTQNADLTYSYPTNQQVNPDAFPIQPSNNPGNIRPINSKTGFNEYGSVEDGITAIDKNLQAYGTKHGINTLAGVISRWSPPEDGNDTPALIKNASKRLGISPDQPIDLSDPVQRHAISSAIMLQENQIFKKQPPSYGPTAEQTNTIAADKKAKEIEAESSAKARIELPKVIKQAEYADGLLEELLNHPGLEGAVGLKTPQGALNISGTDEAGFIERLKQIEGQQFLQAFESLKGGGAITEIEGQKATQALSRLGTAQKETEFKASIADLRKIIKTAKETALQKAGKAEKSEQPQPTKKGVKFLGFE